MDVPGVVAEGVGPVILEIDRAADAAARPAARLPAPRLTPEGQAGRCAAASPARCPLGNGGAWRRSHRIAGGATAGPAERSRTRFQ